MLKSILAVAAMICALPALATAGTAALKTQAQTPGGWIETSLNAGFKQTSAYGAKFYNYSTPAAVAPTGTITTNPGYAASFTATGDCTLTGASFTCGDGGGEVVGYFTYSPVVANMTAVAGTGGKVNMTSIPNVYIGQKLLSSVKFVFTPKAGYQIATSGITFNGSATVPANVVVTGGGAFPVTVTFLSGYAVTGNMALGSTFAPTGGTVPASACAPKTVLVNEITTLTATPAGGTWSKIGGPSVYDATLKKYVPVPAVIDSATGAVSGLTTAGTYYFKYAAGGTYATTSVVVVNSNDQATAASCTGCHDANGVGAGVSTSFPASKHATAGMVCASCHVGADTAAHPGATPTNATCASCHTTLTDHTATTATKCLDCHGSHNPAEGIASLQPTNHPAVTLYTFEEIGMQMAGGNKVPVQVDANGKGMPYSPKQSCGTSGCHIKNGVDYTYDMISDHAFHSSQGRNEYQDSSTGKFDATKNKPWLQSSAMVGKW